LIDSESTLTLIDTIVRNNYPDISDKFAIGYKAAITSESDYVGHSFQRGVVQLLVGNHDTATRIYGFHDAVATTERVFVALGREPEIHAWVKTQRPEDIAGMKDIGCTCQPQIIGA